jgi:tRNA(Ile)-lysidine synthase
VARRVSLGRPLLEFSKEEIVAFARGAHIRFREDASNASSEFERNWVRLELLPLLRKRQPAVGKNILRAMQIIGAEAEFVTRLADAWRERGFGKPDAALECLPVAVQRRVVQLQIRALGVEPDFQLVEELRTKPDRPVSVGPQIELVCYESGLVHRAEADATSFESDQRIVELPGSRLKPGLQAVETRFAGLRLKWRMMRLVKSFSPKRKAGREFFDADKVGAQLVLRHWRAGDRFQPIGLPQATKLQDWFTNRKVPAARRRQLVLAETERGEVFWVEGERIGEGCKVTPATRRVLELRWKQA